MSADDLTLAFHIGAHKTATTHLQRSLMKSVEGMAAAGVRYYGPQDFRLPGRSIFALFGLKDDLPSGPRRSPQAQLALMRKDATRVVFSEENFIGVLNSPRRMQVTQRYPHAAIRISRLAAALERPVDVLLGIRHPTAFLNSAYCQQLMGGRVVPFARYHQINPVKSVDWLDLVTRLRAAEGVGQVTVWCYEDYTALFPRICRALVGANAATLVRPLDRRIHEGLSAEAVAETLARHARDQTEKLGFAMRKTMPVGPKNPRFDGFGANTHAAGDVAYARQIAGIRALSGVTFLDPDQPD
ncbi:hypothetical protein SLH49_21630 [Cognatiyoonia sp. IB215446]|uniref:hypothetical protein n=1 Tax=Cognatiyoonia sp. IB215446 TaxID=3097355 RepID=UPI002A183DB8|nr:hypothetical protein [Cognatiyoonia sp. IB215446]MDX8350600.1 hypothetical protein [Cognatiyoonia sp. IB215446]